MDDAADLAGTVEQVAQPGDDVVVVPGVAVEDGGRVGEDVVQGKRHLAADRLDRGARGALLLGLEQLQRVQGRGDVPAVDLEELAVAVVEVVRLGALDIERADDRAVIDQRDGERAARVLRPLDVERVLGRVGAEVALPGRRHEARHAVAFLPGQQLAIGREGDIPSLSRGVSLPVGLSSRRISM